MKLIKINTDHYVIVDDSEIKEGDWLYSFDNGLIVQANKGSADTINSKSLNGKGYGKITHSTQPLEGVELLSLSEVKKLIGEVDVEKKIYSIVEKVMGSHNMKSSTAKDMISIGISSYNQAIKDNKEKKYTEEDLRKAIAMGYDWCHQKHIPDDWMIDNFIQQLQQPKTEWEVEFIDEKLKLKQ